MSQTCSKNFPKTITQMMSELSDLGVPLSEYKNLKPKSKLCEFYKKKIEQSKSKKTVRSKSAKQVQSKPQQRRSAIYVNAEEYRPEDWEFGNIINFSKEGSYDRAIVVGFDKVPIVNGEEEVDMVRIPVEITKHMKDPLQFYKKLIEDEIVNTVDLDYKSPYVYKKYGKYLPEAAFYRFRRVYDYENIPIGTAINDMPTIMEGGLWYKVDGMSIHLGDHSFNGVDQIIKYINEQIIEYNNKLTQ